MSTFTANEVITKVEGLNTVKTLNRWRKVVEEHFGMNYFRHNFRNNTLSSFLYSVDDMERFQMVAFILAEQASNQKNLQQAIITAFSSKEPFVKKKTELEVLEDNVYRMMHDLAEEDKRLHVAILELNHKLTSIEKQLSEEKDNTFKLFRRK